MTNEQAIEKIKRQQGQIDELRMLDRDNPAFSKWKRDTALAIDKIFNDRKHGSEFYSINYFGRYSNTHNAYIKGLEDAFSLLQSFIDEISEWGIENNTSQLHSQKPIQILENMFRRFPKVVEQLKSRHNSRPAMTMDDEYDVQDLTSALLKLHFDDIRDEEYSPTYAATASRTDFFLKSEEIFIEIKKTRKGLGQKEVTNELIIDIQRYQKHPGCRALICFISPTKYHRREPVDGSARCLGRVKNFV